MPILLVLWLSKKTYLLAIESVRLLFSRTVAESAKTQEQQKVSGTFSRSPSCSRRLQRRVRRSASTLIGPVQLQEKPLWLSERHQF